MMTALKFSGRCVSRIRLAVCLLAGVSGFEVQAMPADGMSEAQLQALIDAAQRAWAEVLMAQHDALEPFDTQIFTDFSPLLDSPNGVRLPADQRLDPAE